MSDFAPLILSILMLATLLLGAGGVFLIAKKRDVRRGVLMLVAAVVMLANVLIWSLPAPTGMIPSNAGADGVSP